MQDCFLKPTPNRLLIKEDEFKYSGRLVIPEVAKRRPTTGTVIAVGSNVDAEWLGKRILYARFSGILLTFKNQPAMRALEEQEIIAEVLKTDAELELDDTSLNVD